MLVYVWMKTAYFLENGTLLLKYPIVIKIALLFSLHHCKQLSILNT